MKLKTKLDKGAILPTRAHSHDGGLDLYSPHDIYLPGCHVFNDKSKLKYTVSAGMVCIDTGVHVAIPEGFVGDIKSKSGLMVKNNITTDGTIDCGYTGSIVVKLFNHGSEGLYIKKGQKIAQLVIKSIITPEPELVDSLDDTERGEGGFGSTGAF